MEKINWAVSIAIALIGLIGAWLANRSVRSAAKYSSDANVLNARTAAETDAYNRARKMDTETIERLEKESRELRKENEDLRLRLSELQYKQNRLFQENTDLKTTVTRLERYINARRHH